jgi:hypothetical protein
VHHLSFAAGGTSGAPFACNLQQSLEHCADKQRHGLQKELLASPKALRNVTQVAQLRVGLPYLFFSNASHLGDGLADRSAADVEIHARRHLACRQVHSRKRVLRTESKDAAEHVADCGAQLVPSLLVVDG